MEQVWTKDEEEEEEEPKTKGRWSIIREVASLPKKWKRSDSKYLGIFFFLFLFYFSFFFRCFTLYQPIFIFRPISSIFSETAGTSQYDLVFEAERNSRVFVLA